MTTQGLLRRYTFKLYPNKAQTAALDSMRRLHCTLYNAALQERIDAYRLAGKTLTFFDQSKAIKIIRSDDPAYADLGFDSLALTLRRLDMAYAAFFRRARAGAGHQSGFPRYQRGDDYAGFTFRSQKGWNFDFRPNARSGRTRFKGVPGAVSWRGKFPAFPYGIKTGDVMLRAGTWWLSVVADMPERMARSGELTGEIEFDLVDSFAHVRCANGGLAAGPEETVYAAEGRITSVFAVVPRGRLDFDRGVFTDPKRDPLDHSETDGAQGVRPRLRNLREPLNPSETTGTQGEGVQRSQQRKMSKARRGSCRWRAAKRAHARQEAKRARQRREALHAWTTDLARRFANLTIISPTITAITASGAGDKHRWGAAVDLKANFNRRVLDMAPATAIAMLQYKIAERSGTVTVRVPTEAKADVGNLIVAATKANRKLKRASNAR
jgi:hypothetical protein